MRLTAAARLWECRGHDRTDPGCRPRHGSASAPAPAVAQRGRRSRRFAVAAAVLGEYGLDRLRRSRRDRRRGPAGVRAGRQDAVRARDRRGRARDLHARQRRRADVVRLRVQERRGLRAGRDARVPARRGGLAGRRVPLRRGSRHVRDRRPALHRAALGRLARRPHLPLGHGDRRLRHVTELRQARRRGHGLRSQRLRLRHERVERVRVPPLGDEPHVRRLRRPGRAVHDGQRALQRSDRRRRRTRGHARICVLLQLPGQAGRARPRGKRHAHGAQRQGVLHELRHVDNVPEATRRPGDDQPGALARRQAALRDLALPVRRRRIGGALRPARRRHDQGARERLLDLVGEPNHRVQADGRAGEQHRHRGRAGRAVGLHGRARRD